MKIRLLFVFIIVLSIPLNARADAARKSAYVGIHGNISSSHLTDGDVFSSGSSERNIDNGNKRSNSFSITLGAESVKPIGMTGDKAGVLVGFEVFYDNIGKIVGQGGTAAGPGRPRPRDHQSIYKSKYILGFRCKLGFELFQRVNVYGHLGLAYWDRDFYLDFNDTGGMKVYRGMGMTGAYWASMVWAAPC